MGGDEVMMNDRYDLAIIGGGAAGLVAAPFAMQIGARVAFIEKDRIGGDCTWTGCVPSKTLIKSAKVAYQMRTADRFGLAPVDATVDLKQVMEHVTKQDCRLFIWGNKKVYCYPI